MLCWQQYSFLLTGLIHKFIIETYVLQCFLVRGSKGKKRRGRIISNFTKGDFFISYINQVLLGIISQCGPPPCTLPKKAFLSPSVWARREYIWKLSWKESLLICFKIARVSPVPTDRVGIGWWTLPPYVRDSLEDKSMLLHFKKAFPFTSLGHSFERRAYCLLLCFESYQGIPYSHTGQVNRGWWTLC